MQKIAKKNFKEEINITISTAIHRGCILNENEIMFKTSIDKRTFAE